MLPNVADQAANGCTRRRASAEQVVLVAGRQAQVDPESDPVFVRLLDRLLHANRDVANSAGVAERREDPAIADAVVYRTEEVNLRVGRADPANGRIGCDDDVGRDDTARRSRRPDRSSRRSVMNAAERLTLESIELTVVMTSSRPPRSSALSCVNTAGTDCRSMLSIESNASR